MPLHDNPIHRLAGVRPTGRLHIGHYFAVVKPALDLGATVLIAEYHAPKATLQDIQYTHALLDLSGVRDIRWQSVEFDAKLYFRLLSIARVGELERMTQYMTAGDDNDAHLLTYPVLMVHDVMGYDEILVGDDQAQHINYARDLIERYNRVFNASVRLPVARTVGGRVMSLTEPDRKMSKSEPDGCVFLDDTPQEIERKIKAAVMDEAGHANLVELYRNLGGTEEIPRMNSEFKPMIANAIIRVLPIVEEA
jgi:tryptophanyl-tRNA synthetase